MVGRIWHGVVPAEKASAYLYLMRRTGLEDYKKCAGNRGAFILERSVGNVVHFLMLSLWESYDVIKNFTGDNIEVAQYYEFDQFFLTELEPKVTHFDLFDSA